MSQGEYRFALVCTAGTYERISAMRAGAKDSSLAEMQQHCADIDGVFASLGYGEELKASEDWHISYHRSEYNGLSCFYFVWSAYEFIFTPGGQHADLRA